MTKRVAKPNKQPEPAKELVKPYEPTPYERRTLDTRRARNAEKPLAPRIKVTNEKGVTKLAAAHAEQSIAYVLLLEALGTGTSTSWTGSSSNFAISARTARRWTRTGSTSCSPWSRA
jgi:hypothetical protein